MPLNKWTKKGKIVLEGVIDSDYHVGIMLLLHNGGKKDDVWCAGDPCSGS
jgi:dUTPase